MKREMDIVLFNRILPFAQQGLSVEQVAKCANVSKAELRKGGIIRQERKIPKRK